tara:strand:- start:2177 stop:2530 length:354 start_codon:yes stop_codon:yes gene_type:complete
MNLISLTLAIFLLIKPPEKYNCDNDILYATIRNNLNGDFALVNDLEEIDKGSFVVLDWKELSLMLPVSFKAGDISFTDKKWLWSYRDNENGLHINTPKFSELLQNGKVIEHSCYTYN